MDTLCLINENCLTIPILLQMNDIELKHVYTNDLLVEVTREFFEELADDFDLDEEDITITSEIPQNKKLFDIIYCYINYKNLNESLSNLKKLFSKKLLIIETHKNIQNELNIIFNFYKKKGYIVKEKVLNMTKYSEINFNLEHKFYVIYNEKYINFDFEDVKENNEEDLESYIEYININEGVTSPRGLERKKFINNLQDKIDINKNLEFFIWKKSYPRKIKNNCFPSVYEETKQGNFNIQSIPFYIKNKNIEEYRFVSPTCILSLHGLEFQDVKKIKSIFERRKEKIDTKEFSISEGEEVEFKQKRFPLSYQYYIALSCPLIPILENIYLNIIFKEE